MQRALLPDHNVDELVDLYTRLDISQLGPAYIQPLLRAGKVVGVALIGLPYTNRELTESETILLEGLAPVAARLLTLSRAALRIRHDAEGGRSRHRRGDLRPMRSTSRASSPCARKCRPAWNWLRSRSAS